MANPDNDENGHAVDSTVGILRIEMVAKTGNKTDIWRSFQTEITEQSNTPRIFNSHVSIPTFNKLSLEITVKYLVVFLALQVQLLNLRKMVC